MNKYESQEWANTVAVAHSIMSEGVIKHCSKHFKDPSCNCCEFGDGHGENFIGVLPREMEVYVAFQGDTSNWKYTDGLMKDNPEPVSSLACTRADNGFAIACGNKPLDCKMYPYSPLSVDETNGTYVVELATDDQFCPLFRDAEFLNDQRGISSHAMRVARVAIEFYNRGFMHEMKLMTARSKGNKDYSSFVFEIPKVVDVYVNKTDGSPSSLEAYTVNRSKSLIHKSRNKS